MKERRRPFRNGVGCLTVFFYYKMHGKSSTKFGLRLLAILVSVNTL